MIIFGVTYKIRILEIQLMSDFGRRLHTATTKHNESEGMTRK